MNCDLDALAANAKSDCHALGVLCALMLERAHRMCLAQLRSHHDAEEAAALAVSWMWRYLGGYDSERHFELWFCRIVHNAVKHVVKTHARRLRQLDETQEAEVIADQLSPMEVLIE